MIRLRRPLFLLLGVACLAVALYFYRSGGVYFRDYGLPLVLGAVLCWSALERRADDDATGR